MNCGQQSKQQLQNKKQEMQAINTNPPHQELFNKIAERMLKGELTSEQATLLFKKESEAKERQERREKKLEKEKQKKLVALVKKLTPEQSTSEDMIELGILRTKMRYLKNADYIKFLDVEKWWDKSFLTDSEEEEEWSTDEE
jgi:hypothetical protein